MEKQKKKGLRVGLGLYLNCGLSFVFICAAIFVVQQVKLHVQGQALLEAESKAKLILDRNLSIHTYFSHNLKPKVFALTEPVRAENYFEPAWMSSTYAVREIDKHFKSLCGEKYYYKECAINARSPENEADAFENAFIEELNGDSNLKYRSLVRKLDGEYYFVTLRRGEMMEKACLLCHSTPERAPKNLVDLYGSKRSFNRRVNDVVSAISIRVPLSAAYKKAEQFSRRLSIILVCVLLVLFALQYFLYKFLVLGPVTRLKDRALKISNNEEFLGEEIPLPVSREFSDLAAAFNAMSGKLSHQMNNLESMVDERTSELRNANKKLQGALKEIKILQGILPVCSYCKNIRDDQGYWNKIETYISTHSDAQFSHGICPECLEKYYPEEFQSPDIKDAIKEDDAGSEETS